MAEPEDRYPQCRGNWVDEEVHVCPDGPNTLVTSRQPDDLPAFCTEMVRAFHSTLEHA